MCKCVTSGVYQFVSGAWTSISEKQDPLTGLPQIGTFGEGQFAFDPMTLFSDPSSAIVEADNIFGFQLAPAAVLPVAALAYFLLFREPILGVVDGIISKYTQPTKTCQILS